MFFFDHSGLLLQVVLLQVALFCTNSNFHIDYVEVVLTNCAKIPYVHGRIQLANQPKLVTTTATIWTPRNKASPSFLVKVM